MDFFAISFLLNFLKTILELAEQKAQYLGLQTFRSRNLSREGEFLDISCIFWTTH